MIAADSVGLMLPLAVLASYMIVAISGYALHSLISFRRQMSLATFLRYAVAMSINIQTPNAAWWDSSTSRPSNCRDGAAFATAADRTFSSARH